MQWLPAAMRVLQAALGAIADVLDGKDVDSAQLANEIDNNLAMLGAELRKMRTDRESLPDRWAADLDSQVDDE